MGGEPRPHYVTQEAGQIRLWRAGAGPDLVALAGPTLAASATAARLTAACPGWRVTALELPGIGGSARHAAATVGEIGAAVAGVLSACGIGPCAIAGLELAGTVAAETARRHAGGAVCLPVWQEAAAAWARSGLMPPDPAPRTDGTHLTALWSFLRDRHLLLPADPRLPAAEGEPLPDAAELDATVVAAAVEPCRFSDLWQTLARATEAAGPEGEAVVSLPDLHARLAALDLPEGTGNLPATDPLPGAALWHEEVETARGRMHLRRAGAEGRPTLVIPTGGGSSAQFAPVVTGLAAGAIPRRVFALDYLGNGLSEKPDRGDVDMGMLAADVAALLDAMGIEEVDIWGSHTGALVALEFAVRHPDRAGRAVLEGPVFLDPDFSTDILRRYFPPVAPDQWGLHLPLVWNWRRDMFLYWPWYRVERAAARRLGLPSARDLHDYAIGILESGPSYDGAYRAAFAYPTRERMPLLGCPALVCAGPNDMLIAGLDETEKLGLPGVEVRRTPTTVWWPDPEPGAAAETMALYRAFLDG